MVASIEHQTSEQTEPLELSVDRSIGRSIFKESFIFLLYNEDILANRSCIVAQEEDTASEQYRMHTVLVDDKRQSEGYVVWQHTDAGDAGRTVRQMRVSSNGEISGWLATYDAQGRAVTVLDDESITPEENWRGIQAIIYGKSCQNRLAVTRERYEKTQTDLAQFIMGQLSLRQRYNAGNGVERSGQMPMSEKKYKERVEHSEERLRQRTSFDTPVHKKPNK